MDDNDNNRNDQYGGVPHLRRRRRWGGGGDDDERGSSNSSDGGKNDTSHRTSFCSLVEDEQTSPLTSSSDAISRISTPDDNDNNPAKVEEDQKKKDRYNVVASPPPHSSSSSSSSPSSVIYKNYYYYSHWRDVLWWFDDVTFGWDHLSTKILGHVFIPIMAFVVVRRFFFLERYHLHLALLFMDFTNMRTDRDMEVYNNMTRRPYSPLGTIVEQALSFIIPILASVLALRVVRNRRRVWFRYPFGSRSYYNDSGHRRESIKIADKQVDDLFSSFSQTPSTTIISRLLQRRRDRQLKKKKQSLEKAKRIFHHKHQKEEEERCRWQQQQEQHHQNQSGTILSSSSPSSSSSSSLSLSPSSSSQSFSPPARRTNEVSADTVSPAAAAAAAVGATITSGDITSFVDDSRTTAAQTVFHQHVIVPSIHNIPYAHGGYFGAAPFMLADRRWVYILRRLLPDVYVEISGRVVNCHAPQLIHWAENNPVVAAYGTWIHLCRTTGHQNDNYRTNEKSPINEETTNKETIGPFPALEWDVFIDPDLVWRMEALLKARDAIETDLCPDGGTIDKLTRDRKEDVEFELEQVSEEIVDRLLIAHGNLWQLMLEQTGVLKQFNYQRVLSTRQTLGGGMFARHWMAVFAQAIRLASSSSPSSYDDIHYDDNSSDEDTTDNVPFETMVLSGTIADSMRKIKEAIGPDFPLRIVLDIKSRHFIPKRVWASVIDTLHSAGIGVCGIASFQMDEIRGVTNLCQNASYQTKEILFVHSAGDIQAACESGKIQPGDQVYFNCGSLLYTEQSFVFSFPFDPNLVKESYKVHPCVKLDDDKEGFITLRQYKKHYGFSLGCYLQEFAVDDAALSLLVDLVNTNRTLFDLGLAWGGLNGCTVHNVYPGRFTLSDGYWDQRRLGKNWKQTKAISSKK